MVNGSKISRPQGEQSVSDSRRVPTGRAWTKLVNSGQDTQITLTDGSTIVVKGVTRIDAVVSGKPDKSGRYPSPIGGEISGDGE